MQEASAEFTERLFFARVLLLATCSLGGADSGVVLFRVGAVVGVAVVEHGVRLGVDCGLDVEGPIKNDLEKFRICA